jgi:hypothetical protein
MLQAIEGIYRNGRIELTETPEGIAEGKVVVTFLSVVPVAQANQMISLGMFKGDCQSTEADFREAEYHDEADSQFIGTPEE